MTGGVHASLAVNKRLVESIFASFGLSWISAKIPSSPRVKVRFWQRMKEPRKSPTFKFPSFHIISFSQSNFPDFRSIDLS